MGNRDSLQASTMAACFHCRRTFPPQRIVEWVDDGETALCPRCGIDAVLGDASGAPVLDAAWLGAMRRRWFGAGP